MISQRSRSDCGAKKSVVDEEPTESFKPVKCASGWEEKKRGCGGGRRPLFTELGAFVGRRQHRSKSSVAGGVRSHSRLQHGDSEFTAHSPKPIAFLAQLSLMRAHSRFLPFHPSFQILGDPLFA